VLCTTQKSPYGEKMEKGLELIKDLVIDELEDFGYFDYKDIIFKEEYPKGDFYYIVTIKTIDNKEKELRFKYESEEDKISIQIGEDSYNEIRGYDSSIKYLWMTLLKWEV
jgi:hypothetical protein